MPVEQKIEPALSAEEWATYPKSFSPCVNIGGEEKPLRPHALAALCLHSIPGVRFTREDWWQIDQAAMDAEDLPRPGSQVNRLRFIAAKIEALLPPEEVDTQGK